MQMPLPRFVSVSVSAHCFAYATALWPRSAIRDARFAIPDSSFPMPHSTTIHLGRIPVFRLQFGLSSLIVLGDKAERIDYVLKPGDRCRYMICRIFAASVSLYLACCISICCFVVSESICKSLWLTRRFYLIKWLR